MGMGVEVVVVLDGRENDGVELHSYSSLGVGFGVFVRVLTVEGLVEAFPEMMEVSFVFRAQK